MKLNEERLASGITIWLIKKRQYHLWLSNHPFHLDSWKYDRFIRINEHIFIRDLKAHTDGNNPCAPCSFYLEFIVEIDNQSVSYYQCFLDTDKKSRNFGNWKVYKKSISSQYDNKSISGGNLFSIIRWYEKMRHVLAN